MSELQIAARKIQSFLRTRKRKLSNTMSAKSKSKSKSKSPNASALYPRRSFEIDGITLRYFTREDRYDNSSILTYFGSDESTIFERIFQPLIEMQKNTPSCEAGNVCGPNASKICEYIRRSPSFFRRLGFEVIENGIYFISPGKRTDFKDVRKILESHYGNIGGQTTSHYHAIPFIVFGFENHVFYVAIEPTHNFPYKMQFFVAFNEEKLLELLKLRYHYKKIVKSTDCSNDWMLVYR